MTHGARLIDRAKSMQPHTHTPTLDSCTHTHTCVQSYMACIDNCQLGWVWPDSSVTCARTHNMETNTEAKRKGRKEGGREKGGGKESKTDRENSLKSIYHLLLCGSSKYDMICYGVARAFMKFPIVSLANRLS